MGINMHKGAYIRNGLSISEYGGLIYGEGQQLIAYRLIIRWTIRPVFTLDE
jgi:hypothetical protein